MDLGLKNKLALVTGSTQGIGRAIAQALVDEGARVIVNGRNRHTVDATVKALAATGVKTTSKISSKSDTSSGANICVTNSRASSTDNVGRT